METENQIRVLQTTLLNQTVKQHNEQVIKDKKVINFYLYCFFKFYSRLFAVNSEWCYQLSI